MPAPCAGNGQTESGATDGPAVLGLGKEALNQGDVVSAELATLIEHLSRYAEVQPAANKTAGGDVAPNVPGGSNDNSGADR